MTSTGDAERGPDVVVVDAGGHHADQHLVGPQLGGHVDLLELEALRSARRSDPGGSPARCMRARHLAERRASRRARRGPSCGWSPGAASGRVGAGSSRRGSPSASGSASCGLVRFSSPMVERGPVGVVVAGEEHGVVGQRRRARRCRLRYMSSGFEPGQVDAPARADEERVAGHHRVARRGSTASRACGPGVCSSFTRELADRTSSPPSTGDDVRARTGPSARWTNGSSALWMYDLGRASRDELGRAGDADAHQRAAEMIGMEVRDQVVRDAVAVGLGDLDDARRCPTPRRPPPPRASRGRRSGRRSSASGRPRAA